jgi:hypothetical protein
MDGNWIGRLIAKNVSMFIFVVENGFRTKQGCGRMLIEFAKPVVALGAENRCARLPIDE